MDASAAYSRKLAAFGFFLALALAALPGPSGVVLAQPLPAGLDLRLRADQGVVTNAGRVEQWTDQSGNGYSVVATSPASAPAYLLGAVGGQPAIRFDGVDDFLVGGDVMDDVFAGDDAQFTVFAVTGDIADPTPGDGGAASILSKSTADTNQRGVGVALFEDRLYTITYYATGLGNFRSARSDDRITDGPKALHVVYDGTVDTNNGLDRFAMFVDGDAQNLTYPFVSGPLGSVQDNTARLSVGASSNPTGTGAVGHLAGDVAEILVYGRLLSVSEQQQVEAYFCGKYGAACPATITLTATNATPLSVPPGGAVTFDFTVTNNTSSEAVGDLWFTAETAGGAPVAQGVILSGTLSAGQTASSSYTQGVPSSAPAGTYTYRLRIGRFPGQVVDEEVFTVQVTGSARDSGSSAWMLRDTLPWTSEAPPSAASRSDEALVVYPNPAWDRATVDFALPEAGPVRLTVYDLLGRAVAVLAEGTMEAGEHTAAFEVAGLPSGTYLVRLEADGAVETQRLSLIR